MDLINNNISRDVLDECANRLNVQGIYIAAIWMMKNSEYRTGY